MKKIKCSIGIFISIILLCFNSCQENNETKPGKGLTLKVQSDEKQSNTLTKEDINIPTEDDIKEEVILEIDTIAILELFTNIKIRTLPYYDSTNFDNIIEVEPLNDEAIQFLSLKKIYPYDMEEVEKIWLRDKVELSDDFLSFIFCYQPGENELFTTLVTYTADFQLIAFEKIAYDEIAESCFRTESNFEKNKITVLNFDYCFDDKKEEKEYNIDRKGLIHQL